MVPLLLIRLSNAAIQTAEAYLDDFFAAVPGEFYLSASVEDLYLSASMDLYVNAEPPT